jgi:putative transcriptional regulator
MRIHRSKGEASPGYLDGQLLVAMPGMMDERFHRSVIYVCAHSAEGAMGIVVNRPAPDLSLPDLLVQLDIIPKADAIRLPDRVERMQVLMGGPVETSRGFVLHTPDFFLEQSTLPIDDGICLTATVDILRAIASGSGPNNALLALGYAGWGAGQLESEIQGNGWLNCPPARTSSSTPPSTSATTAPCAPSASTRACCRPMRGTPEGPLSHWRGGFTPPPARLP